MKTAKKKSPMAKAVGAIGCGGILLFFVLHLVAGWIFGSGKSSNDYKSWAHGEAQRFNNAHINVRDVDASDGYIGIYVTSDVTGAIPELASGSAMRFKETFPGQHPMVYEYAADGTTKLGSWQF